MHPHNDVQATVTPVPDAEPPPGSGQNIGIGGTTHAVADEGRPSAAGPADNGPRAGRRLRAIRYAHAGHTEPAASTGPVERVSPPPVTPPTTTLPVVPPPAGSRNQEVAPPAGALPPTTAPAAGIAPPSFDSAAGFEPPADEAADYGGTAGLVYEAPQADYSEVPFDEPDESVRNDGLGIFGGVATTEVPDDDVPAEAFGHQPAKPRSAPEPGRVIPVGAAWNQTITSPPVASSGPQERRQGPFGRIRGMRTES